MRKFRTQDFYKIKKSDKNARLYSAGVPSRLWNENYTLNPSHFSFKGTKGKDTFIRDKTQKAWLDKLITKEVLQQPYLTGFGGAPTDEVALIAASRIIKAALGLGLQAFMFDVASKEFPDPKDQVIALYNITAESDYHRTQHVRDLISRNQDSFRMVVVAGNPGEVLLNKIKVVPQALFWFEGIPTRKVSL